MQYKLEEVVRRGSQIYKQMYKYYYFCEHVRNLSPITITSKVYVINSFLRSCKITNLRQVTDQMIYDWISVQKSQGNTGRSINDRLAHVRAMLRWQQEMNIKMPSLHLALITKVNEVPPRKQYFSRKDIYQVLSRANEIEWLLIHLAFDCGLRIGELQKLRICHLADDRLTIYGKGNRRRYVYICDEVKQCITSWIKKYQITDYLWPSPVYSDEPLSCCTIRSYMKRAFARCGYDDFCPHDLRHSYATDLKNLGLPTRQIQAGLGHAAEAVTERYLSDLDGFNIRTIYQIKYSKAPL